MLYLFKQISILLNLISPMTGYIAHKYRRTSDESIRQSSKYIYRKCPPIYVPAATLRRTEQRDIYWWAYAYINL